ncbi:MAG: hypothetical protein ABI743_12445, partial [bacterium]
MAGGFFHRTVARILAQAFGIAPPSWWAFPWYLYLFDLLVHHWIFALVRRWLAGAVLDMLPAVGLLLERGASRSWNVKLWRATLGRLGARLRQRQAQSLGEAILQTQHQNGSWAWTLFGTSLNLLALRSIDFPSDHRTIQRALAYVAARREVGSAGAVSYAWGGTAVWDTALVTEALLLAGEVPELASAGCRWLAERQLLTGLMGFDIGSSRGDHDSTAVAISAMGKAYRLVPEVREPWLLNALSRATEALVAGQLREGGWGFAPSQPLASS